LPSGPGVQKGLAGQDITCVDHANPTAGEGVGLPPPRKKARGLENVVCGGGGKGQVPTTWELPVRAPCDPSARPLRDVSGMGGGGESPPRLVRGDIKVCLLAEVLKMDRREGRRGVAGWRG